MKVNTTNDDYSISVDSPDIIKQAEIQINEGVNLMGIAHATASAISFAFVPVFVKIVIIQNPGIS